MTELTDEYDEDYLYGPAEEPDLTDADAFFAAEVSPVRPAVLRLYDHDYTLPTRVPLAFRLLLERHDGDSSLAAFRATLAPLFGAGALDEWIEQGIDDRRLGIVLAWSIANMAEPGSISLAEAAAAYDEQARGKAPTPSAPSGNRAARRRQQRAGGGGRSSRGGRS